MPSYAFCPSRLNLGPGELKKASPSAGSTFRTSNFLSRTRYSCPILTAASAIKVNFGRLDGRNRPELKDWRELTMNLIERPESNNQSSFCAINTLGLEPIRS